MPPSDVGDFLRRHNVVDNDADLCMFYNNYVQTPLFLETVSPTHQNIWKATKTWYKHTSDDICAHYRSLSRQQCENPPCLVSGPWLSEVPSDQRSTDGLTNASKPTWFSSIKSWSAPIAHIMLHVWPSKNCAYALHKPTVVVWIFCNQIHFLISCLVRLFSHQIHSFLLFFQGFSSR